MDMDFFMYVRVMNIDYSACLFVSFLTSILSACVCVCSLLFVYCYVCLHVCFFSFFIVTDI